MPLNTPPHLLPFLLQTLLLLSTSSLLFSLYTSINNGLTSSFSPYYIFHLLIFLTLHFLAYKIISRRSTPFFARFFANCPLRFLPPFCTFLIAHLCVNLTGFVWGKLVLLVFTGSLFQQPLTPDIGSKEKVVEGIKEFAASGSTGIGGEKVVEKIQDFASSVGVPSQAVSEAAKVVTSVAAKISDKVADVVKSVVVEAGRSVQEAARTNDTAATVMEKVAEVLNATVATPEGEL